MYIPIYLLIIAFLLLIVVFAIVIAKTIKNAAGLHPLAKKQRC